MAVLPVTQEQHSAVTGEHPGAARGARLPVERVSWWDAVRFSNALSEQAARMPAYRVRGEEIDRDPAARIDDGVPGRLPVS
jgi:formylglycine-generating enzyme required for sulfatase activity